MGTYTFKWEHPAQDVYVTGTFDSWGKTVKLEKAGDVFEKEVTLPESSEKIYYKFVVDGDWTTNSAAPQENDSEGNLNNVLLPEDIKKAEPEAAIMSSVGPESTTADLAKKVPLEKDLPGAFPETPTPAQESKDFSVNPLPATGGFGNAVKLAPGEKIPAPEEVTTNTIQSGVTLDKESYEKPDQLPGGNVASNGAAVAATSEPPAASKNIIPESGLPMGEPSPGAFDGTVFQSAGPTATTAILAGQVPLEAKTPVAEVPEVVKESQEAAGVSPEASAIPGEVAEKSKLEEELKEKVPEAPATSEATSSDATAIISNGKPADKIADSTPEVVKESIEAAGQSPEATTNPEAVAEKKETEKELLSAVKPETATGEPAPKIAGSGAVDSRDVSPHTVPAASKDAKTESSKATPAVDDKAEKKKKRTSFFGKLKAKFSDKH